MLGLAFAGDPQPTPELVGLVVVMLFAAQCLATIPAAFALRWILREDSGRKTAVRYGTLLILLIAANSVAFWILANDPIPDNGMLRRISGLIVLAASAFMADLFIAAWLFAFVLAVHELLRAAEGIAWRVAE
jgi:hypothetical protein